MSTPQPLFSVTLTAAELAHLVTAYRFMRHESEMASAFDALNAAKPVRARATRTAAAVEPWRADTGDAALDSFMTRKHDPKWKPLPMPKAPGLPPLRPMKVSEMDAAEAAWKSACDKARATVADGKPSDAEREMRALIAIHRNPWRVEAIEKHPRVERGQAGWARDGETRILTSPRHPGVAIHETTRDHSKTWRVIAGGVLSEKTHYAAAAAELEADELVLAFT